MSVLDHTAKAHSEDECQVCAENSAWSACVPHRKVPPDLTGLEQQLLLMHRPTGFKSCKECHETWPCLTNKVIHHYLKEQRERQQLG